MVDGTKSSATIIEEYLSDERRINEGVYHLELSSEHMGNRVIYRADIGYETTGKWSYTIQGALDELVKELKRQGEIK